MQTDDTQAFLDAVADELGYPALSEAKTRVVHDPTARVLITEDDHILGVGVVARHTHADGRYHHAIETAVERSMRFPAFEKAIVTETMRIVPEGPTSAWSRRPTLDDALVARGFEVHRTLLHMSVDLPLSGQDVVGQDGSAHRAIRDGEEILLIEINNLAFAHHREAGRLTRADYDHLSAQHWFDRNGILVAEDAGALVGFCWTKVHPNGDGEIYRIGVHPNAQGSGFGRSLVLAGMQYLAGIRDVRTGTLWVDESNGVAVALYRSIGMRVDAFNREFELRA